MVDIKALRGVVAELGELREVPPKTGEVLDVDGEHELHLGVPDLQVVVLPCSD